MSEEDTELRDLVAQTLERNGCLAKIRAELRASIFLALDEDIKLSQQQPLQNLRVQSYIETPEGQAMFCLVREFLEFFNLECTLSVFERESYLHSIGQYKGRQKVAKDLGLDSEDTIPLLQQVLKIAQTKCKVLDINLNINSGNLNGSFKDDSSKLDSSYKKTDETYTSIESQLSQDKSNRTEGLNKNLNTTFDINSPRLFSGTKTIINNEHEVKLQKIDEAPTENSQLGNIESNKSVEKNGQLETTYEVTLPLPVSINVTDDTYEDTSSIAEDSGALEKTNHGAKRSDVPYNTSPVNSNSENGATKTSISSTEVEKPKLSHQRPKTSLSSLSDLPPIPLNKTRVNSDILPSLYSKDFKNKSNLKELDKIFDMEAEYEEDFMYSNELPLNSPAVDLSQSKGIEELGSTNKTDMLNIINKKDSKGLSKVSSDIGKSLIKLPPTKCSNLNKNSDHSNNSSISEHSPSESVNSIQ